MLNSSEYPVSQTPQIMVVDDSRLARASMEQILRADGYNRLILCEGSGPALQALGIGEGQAPASGIDLILLDVEMPAIDGIELCRIIKGTDSFRDVPVIMVTSLSQLDILAQAFEAGASDYITKPPKEIELLARVRSALALRHESQRRKAHEEELLKLTKRLATAHQELLAKQALLDQDFKAAGEIQKSLLPRKAPRQDGLLFAWEFMPSQFIGGDIFNLVDLGPTALGAYILDVTGHGVPAALVSVSVFQSLLPTSGLIQGQGGPTPPGEVLRALDRDYPLERFNKTFTMAYLLLDPRTGALAYANAGHPRPMVFRADGSWEELDVASPLIGLAGMAPYEQGTASLLPGDRVVMYTDGLVELENAKGEAFGQERLVQALGRSNGQGLDTWLALTKAEALAFAGGRPPADDISMLAVEFTGSAPA